MTYEVKFVQGTGDWKQWICMIPVITLINLNFRIVHTVAFFYFNFNLSKLKIIKY